MTKAAPLIISSLTAIVACALLAVTEARAVPYVVTVDDLDNDVAATSDVDGDSI